MTEAAELGRKVSKRDFKAREPMLHTQLLAAQRELGQSDTSVIIIVAGVEGAGKGGVVNRLNEWLDSRGIRTVAFWDETEEERERPTFWRFWRTLPPRGSIGILFGSWYTQAIIKRVYGDINGREFTRRLKRVAQFEHMLSLDGTLVVKFWFHLTKEAQHSRLQREAKGGGKGAPLSPLTRKFSKHYDSFARVSEQAIHRTDTGDSPWHIVNAEDRRHRDLTVGSILLDSLGSRLETGADPSAVTTPQAPAPRQDGGATGPALAQVDLSRHLEKDYDKQLRKYQRRLYDRTWKARRKGISTVALFEGWDAAGKGGAIRRVTAGIDARLYRVISVAAPTDEEKAHHYLWRFWRHVPRAGYVTLYDRSWYGRVLVERVEGFAQRQEWLRAYQEINDFEQQLTEHGMVLLKFWVHLSKDEQLRRFKERETTPWKQHKITDEDWRNREKWDDYKVAVNDMVARTSTEHAPWTLVAGDDKKFARIQVLKTFCKHLKEAL